MGIRDCPNAGRRCPHTPSHKCLATHKRNTATHPRMHATVAHAAAGPTGWPTGVGAALGSGPGSGPSWWVHRVHNHSCPDGGSTSTVGRLVQGRSNTILFSLPTPTNTSSRPARAVPGTHAMPAPYAHLAGLMPCHGKQSKLHVPRTRRKRTTAPCSLNRACHQLPPGAPSLCARPVAGLPLTASYTLLLIIGSSSSAAPVCWVWYAAPGSDTHLPNCPPACLSPLPRAAYVPALFHA